MAVVEQPSSRRASSPRSSSSTYVCAGGGGGGPRSVQLGLDLLEPPRLGLERGQKRAQVRGGLAQLQLGLAQRLAGRRELGREALDRRDRALGRRDEVGRALAVLRRERAGSRCRRLRELRDVPQPLPLRPQLVLAARLASVCVLPSRRSSSTRPPRAASRVNSSCSRRAACSSRHARARHSPCRLPRTRRARRADTPDARVGAARTGRSSRAAPRAAAHVLPGGAPTPRVGPRAAVGEDAPREHDVVLAFGPQLGERAERLLVDLAPSNSASTYASRRPRRSAQRRPSRRAAARPRW